MERTQSNSFGIRIEGVTVTRPKIQPPDPSLPLAGKVWGAMKRAFGFERVRKRIIQDTDLEIAPESLVAIVGGSGAGKSTLLRALGVHLPDSGQVFLKHPDGAAQITKTKDNLDALHFWLSFVPQNDLFTEELQVKETLMDAFDLADRERKRGEDSRHEDPCDALLMELGLPTDDNFKERQVRHLSGGQRRRLSIARALASNPKILLLDEPTSGLDLPVAQEVMKLLRDLCRTKGLTIICTSHLPTTLFVCDRVVVMSPGIDGEGGSITGDYEADSYQSILDEGEKGITRLYRPAKSIQIKLPPLGPEVPVPTPDKEEARSRDVKTIWQRCFRSLIRDRGGLAVFLFQPPLLAAVVVATQALHGSDAWKFIDFFLGVCAFWIGLSVAVREIVSERALYALERISGLRQNAYLTAKILYVAAAALVGVALLCAATYLFLGLVFEETPTNFTLGHFVPRFVILGFAGVSGAAIGLLVSTLASSEKTALSAMPLVLLPQVVFSKYASGFADKIVDKTGFPYQALQNGPEGAIHTGIDFLNFATGLFMTTRHSSWALESMDPQGALRAFFWGDFGALALLCALEICLLLVAFHFNSKRVVSRLP